MKKIISIFLSLCIVVGLCACGNDTSSNNSTSNDNADLKSDGIISFETEEFSVVSEKIELVNDGDGEPYAFFYATFTNNSGKSSSACDWIGAIGYQDGGQLQQSGSFKSKDHEILQEYDEGLKVQSGYSKTFVIPFKLVNRELPVTIEIISCVMGNYGEVLDTQTFEIMAEVETEEIQNEDNSQEEISKEEETYTLAVLAEDKGYYTVACNLYKEVLTYKDSQTRYDKLHEILAQYNGTYLGESTEYKNVNVCLYVKDGYVVANYENGNATNLLQELYLYGSLDDGTPFFAFANDITESFRWNQDKSYGDGYAIQQLDDGTYLVGATENSNFHTWNGFYKKISDTVEDESIFE